MDIRTVTPTYSVAPQIEPADLAELARAGFTDVISNRPDAEVMPQQSNDAMRAAAEAAGLKFHENPVVNGALTMAEVERQAQILAAAQGPVLAYCRSGTRSTIVWALGRAGQQNGDEIIAAAAAAGYDLTHLRPQLEALSGG
jgi:uncharacterized protein (TIGR01244 family)